jgi:hypothetical protein
MIVLISGSKSITNIDTSLISQAVKQSGFDVTEVMSGVDNQVDYKVIEWANHNNIKTNILYTHWNDLSNVDAIVKANDKGIKYDARAAYRKNQLMIDLSEALLYIWDPSEMGVKDLVERAKKKGLIIFIYQYYYKLL